MQPHPDSALALIRCLDTTALCTPAIKAREAHNYVLRTHDTILTNASLFSIAVLHNNLKNYAEADSIFSQLLLSDKISPYTRPMILECYAQFSASYEKDYEKAVTLLLWMIIVILQSKAISNQGNLFILVEVIIIQTEDS